MHTSFPAEQLSFTLRLLEIPASYLSKANGHPERLIVAFFCHFKNAARLP
jgi:hypothetical protein